MNLRKKIEEKNKTKLQDVLHSVLSSYLDPAFGALPKRETELILLNALQELGVISTNPSIYELVRELKITRSKARSLYYDMELRGSSSQELEEKAIDALKHPILQKQGELFVLEIENPLVSDHLRYMFQQVGYATDGSFSASLVKVPADGIIKLLESKLSDAEKKSVKSALVKAGATEASFRAALKGAFTTLGKKIASDSGEAIAENISDYLGPVWDASSEKILGAFSELFLKTNK